jgi:hypothetical protein
MTEMEMLKRAFYHLAARVTKLEGAARPPAPHVARAVAPQMLGLPGGMGRPPVNQTFGSGVRKIGSNGSVSEPDAAGSAEGEGGDVLRRDDPGQAFFQAQLGSERLSL